MQATAFAPAHISGFFEPVFHQVEGERSGSRGAGINLTLGALTTVSIKQATTPTIDVTINNKSSPAPVTKQAIKNLIHNTPLHLTVNTTLSLPVGQGLGMSGAGALSATLALARIAQLSRVDALKAAHLAEVQLRTGLGDVIASNFGGIEIRREPGLPPWGLIEHIPGDFSVIICVVGKKMNTKTILSDTEKLQEIASHGRYCIKKLLEKPSIEHFFSLSQQFTEKTMLATSKIKNALAVANTHGMASMCMLGNAVFATGDISTLSTVLAPYGKLYFCQVDQTGARLFQNAQFHR